MKFQWTKKRQAYFLVDLNLNINEYLLADRIISKRQAKKSERIMKSLERMCDVRIITCKSRLIFF